MLGIIQKCTCLNVGEKNPQTWILGRIYLTKLLTTKSLPEIGREFSNRDHTTIIHSVKTIEELKEKNSDMRDNINKLKNIILYNRENEI